MSNIIVLNSENYIDGKFIYRFPVQQRFRKGDMVGIQQLNLFNSFYNIESATGNTVQIDFPSGESDWVSVTVTFDDGFYDQSAFQSKIQQAMYDAKMYTDGANSKIIYYLNLGTNTPRYANVLGSWSVPLTAVPVSGATWTQLTGTQRSPRIFFKTIGLLFGFPSESTAITSYGYTEETTLNTYSVITPQINPFQSLALTCNLVSQKLSFPRGFIYSQSINAGFGELISSEAHEIMYNDILEATYNEIEINILTNEWKPITLLDTNATILLSIIKN